MFPSVSLVSVLLSHVTNSFKLIKLALPFFTVTCSLRIGLASAKAAFISRKLFNLNKKLAAFVTKFADQLGKCIFRTLAMRSERQGAEIVGNSEKGKPSKKRQTKEKRRRSPPFVTPLQVRYCELCVSAHKALGAEIRAAIVLQQPRAFQTRNKRRFCFIKQLCLLRAF